MLKRVGAIVASASLVTLGTVGTLSLRNAALASGEFSRSLRNVSYEHSSAIPNSIGWADVQKPRTYFCWRPWC